MQKKIEVEDKLFKTNLTYTGIVKKFDIKIIDSHFQICEKPLCEIQLVEIFNT